MEVDRTNSESNPAAQADVLLREAIDALGCHYALYDADRRLVDFNRTYSDLHGGDILPALAAAPGGPAAALAVTAITYDDLNEVAIDRLMPGVTRSETAAELQHRIEVDFPTAGSGNYDFERAYHDDRWIRVAKRRLSGGQMAGFALDITELKRREAAIVASETRYRALVDSAPVGIWHLDEDGRTLFGNARLAGLYGGVVPASLADAPLHRVDTQAGTGPFGFPPGQEAEALIPASAGRQRANVLVCASGWFSHALNGRRGTVLTLLDITPLKAAQTRAEHLAWHDTLTGLANRSQFGDALDVALIEAAPFALVLVDLDRFKEANDRFGHAAGDAVLCEAATRLRAAATPHDLVCRLGGDEFAVLLRGTDAPGRAGKFAKGLAGSLSAPAHAGAQSVAMSASLGVACWPADAADAEQLQRAADLAMYAAKKTGRARAARFEAAMLEEREHSTLLGIELAGAIREDRLTLVWQPQVKVPGGVLRGAEALVRWPRTQPGAHDLMPGEFLPVAAEAGLMPALDNWVLDAALRQARTWAGNPAAPSRIAVNVSAGTLADRSLPARIAGLLVRYGLSAATLELEVPESLPARDLDNVSPVLMELAEMGVGLALDDFGGGLSSVSHLVCLPVHLLKLDRSIVAGLPGERERTLLRAVMSLADGLSLPVLAEGIETEAQSFVLRREGCTLMQGYLFGRPVSADVLVPSWQAARLA